MYIEEILSILANGSPVQFGILRISLLLAEHPCYVLENILHEECSYFNVSDSFLSAEMGSQHCSSQYSQMDRLSNSEFIKVWHYFLGRRHKLFIEHIPYDDCNDVKSVSLHF